MTQAHLITASSPSTRPFLEVFFETQIFAQLRDVLESEEPDREARAFAHALREWRRGYGLVRTYHH